MKLKNATKESWPGLGLGLGLGVIVICIKNKIKVLEREREKGVSLPKAFIVKRSDLGKLHHNF